MSRDLTEKQKLEIKSLIDKITSLAKDVVSDYADNLSNNSGSIVQIHENSPIIKD